MNICLHHHLFEVVALKEVKLHQVFSSTLLVGAAIDSVSCAYEWEVVWAQQLWVGREVPMQQFCDSVVISTVLKKKKSVENPGFRELVQAWLLILASSCTLGMTLALQYSFKSWKTQCSPRHGYGFHRGSLQLCKRMAGLTAQPHPFAYQAFFSGPVLPWVAHSINHGCSCPVYPLGPLLHLCRL